MNKFAHDSDLSADYRRVLRATPQKIFEAWVNPKWLVRWFAPFNKEIASIELDLRVGGRYRIEMRDDGDGGRILQGEYLEIERPTRLVFTWTNYSKGSDEPRAVDSLVTVELHPVDEQQTELRILHQGFFDDTAKNIHKRSWPSVFDKLEIVLAAEE